MRFVILEDNADRRRVMQHALADRFPAFPVEFFDTSQAIISHLQQTGLYDIAAISLDHDLELIEASDGHVLEPGTGLEVAQWLAGQPSVVPVVVHTTNIPGGDRMVELLVEGGWPVTRIVPYGGEDWIEERWWSIIRDSVVTYGADVSLSAFGAKIVNCGSRLNRDCEWVLHEILLATRVMLSESGNVSSLQLELGRLRSDGTLSTMVSIGPEQIGPLPYGGPLGELLTMIACREQPLLRLSEYVSEWQSQFERLQIADLLTWVIRVDSGYHAILIVSTDDQQFPLRSRRVLAILRELRSLLELSLRQEIFNSRAPLSDERLDRPIAKPQLTPRKIRV